MLQRLTLAAPLCLWASSGSALTGGGVIDGAAAAAALCDGVKWGRRQGQVVAAGRRLRLIRIVV